MNLKTAICDLLNIEYPIIQGGMTYLGHAGLASAVSNAGGLGIVSGNASPDWVAEQINSVRLLTDKPFGINIVVGSAFTAEVIKIILAERVPIVTVGGGVSNIDITELTGAGLIVIPVISSVDSARYVEGLGVDAVVAEGMEAGGHIGRITTMVLVPQVVDAINLPVVAAGGIADGRGLAASLALGAQGVQIGTRFICSEECIAHPQYKHRILEAGGGSTMVIEESIGNPVRCLENEMARKSSSIEKAGSSREELETHSRGKYYSAVIDGDIDNGLLVSGQAAGMVRDIKPAGEIIKQIVAGAERAIAGLVALS